MPDNARNLRAILLISIALAAWAILLRAPFLQAGQINHDDALYWLIGDAWRRGAAPYITYWDLKPPGLYLLYAGVASLFGNRPEGVRLLAMVAVWLTSLGIWRIGSRHTKVPGAGPVAAALYVPYTLVWYGLASEPEMFIAPLVTWAVALALEANSPDARRPGLRFPAVGLLVGIALTLKQTAVFEGALLFGLIALSTRRMYPVAAFCAGAAIPPLGFLAAFAAFGQADRMVSAVIVSALQRVGGDVRASIAPAQFIILLLPGAPLVAAALVGLVERRALVERAPLGLLAAWTGVSALSILAMHASYQYYYQALLAPLCLLSGVTIAHLWRSTDRAPRAAAVALAVSSLVFPAVWFPSTGEAKLAGARTPDRIARYLAEATHGSGGSLYVVDYQPVVYQLSGLRPATRFPIPMQLVCPFPAIGERPEREIARTMASRPDFLVISASRAALLCEIPALSNLPLRIGAGGYRLDRRFKDEMMGTIEV